MSTSIYLNNTVYGCLPLLALKAQCRFAARRNGRREGKRPPVTS